MTHLHLRVLSGRNAGASMQCQQPTLRIGADPQQNDLVLLDPQVLPQHLQIHTDAAGRVLVTAAPGASVLLQGEALAAGTSQVLPATTLLVLGQTELLLECSYPAAPEPVVHLAADRRFTAQADPAPQAPLQPPPPPRRRWRWPIGLLALCGLVLAGAMHWPDLPLDREKIVHAAQSFLNTGHIPDINLPDINTSALRKLRPWLWDQVLDKRAPLPATQSRGAYLYEIPKPVAPPPVVVKAAPRLVLAQVIASKEGPQILGTTSAEQYKLSKDPQQGYELFLATADRIVLRRGQEVVDILME